MMLTDLFTAGGMLVLFEIRVLALSLVWENKIHMTRWRKEGESHGRIGLERGFLPGFLMGKTSVCLDRTKRSGSLPS